MTTAYWCVLIAALMPFVFAGIAKWSPGFDNAKPRVYLAALDGFRQRAHWTQLNSFEMFPMFAAGVLVAQQVGVSQGTIDALAIAYVLARALYGAMYLADWATARSVVWLVALGCVVGLFVAGV